MNNKISKEQHLRLCESNYTEYLFGSRLFGTHNSESDYDYIRVYKYDEVFADWTTSYTPNIHAFQYDGDKEQFVWMTERQFGSNFHSGDGTMISDVKLFTKGKFLDALQQCRTYKIIRAYLGVAKRDLKLHEKNEKKLFHANRSLYIADCLMGNTLPLVRVIQEIAKDLKLATQVAEEVAVLREQAARMYEKKQLHNYFIPEVEDDLLNLMLQSNNTREFKY